MNKRNPFLKHLIEIKIENAHEGAGRRQVILSEDDPISSNMEAMTKGFLSSGGVFDWHPHKDVDEFLLVLKGEGIIEFENDTLFKYVKDDIIYIPSNTNHRIENTGEIDNEFFFIRLKA